MANILLVEDDLTFLQMLQGFLQKHGHNITAVPDIKRGSKLIKEQTFDFLLLDYRLPDGTGLDLLTDIRESGITVPTVIMTSFNDVRTAIRSIRSGASDYITKPVNPDELLMIISNALVEKKPDAKTKNPTQLIKGDSPYAQKLYEHVDLVAPTDMAVLIQGES